MAIFHILSARLPTFKRPLPVAVFQLLRHHLSVVIVEIWAPPQTQLLRKKVCIYKWFSFDVVQGWGVFQRHETRKDLITTLEGFPLKLCTTTTPMYRIRWHIWITGKNVTPKSYLMYCTTHNSPWRYLVVILLCPHPRADLLPFFLSKSAS